MLLAEIALINPTVRAAWDAHRAAEKLTRAVESQFKAILARFNVDDDYEHCEGCGGLIVGGEPAHHYSDGPVTCIECAPTYAESEKEIAEQLLHSESPDDHDELTRSLTNVRARIAAGDGDKKNVWC